MIKMILNVFPEYSNIAPMFVIFCNGHYDFVFNVQIKFLTKNLFV